MNERRLAEIKKRLDSMRNPVEPWVLGDIVEEVKRLFSEGESPSISRGLPPWEYWVATVTEIDYWEAACNELGAEGWELVTVMPDTISWPMEADKRTLYPRAVMRCFFKRPQMVGIDNG